MSRIGGVLILLGFLSTTILASDCPIIFIHGHKSEAKPYDVDEQDSIIGGWTTWYPMHPDGSLKYHTVMTRIMDSHYKGYSAGEPLNCHMNTNLQSTGGEPRKIYNFSYYHPNGNPGGVISLSKESEEKVVDSLKEKQAKSSFWQKLGFGVGYSGGLCYTGRDLMKSQSNWDPLFFMNPANYLYWLHLIEVSVSYPVNDKRRVQIGGGFGCTKIHQSEFDNWEFRMFPLFLGYELSRFRIIGRYVYVTVKDYARTSGSVPKDGKGNGYNLALEYKINKYVRLFLSLGYASFVAEEYFSDHTSEGIWDMTFNGPGISVVYVFEPKGGAK